MSAIHKKCSNQPTEHKTRGALLFEQAVFDWHRFPKIFLIKITNSKSETSCWADVSRQKITKSIISNILLISIGWSTFVKVKFGCVEDLKSWAERIHLNWQGLTQSKDWRPISTCITITITFLRTLNPSRTLYIVRVILRICMTHWHHDQN